MVSKQRGILIVKILSLLLITTVVAASGTAMADPKACQGKPCGGVPAAPLKPTVVVIPKQQLKPAMLQGGASGGILSHNGANIVGNNSSNIVGGNTSNLRRP